jgi:fibronectin-binding autotransporter adhesin
MNIHWRIGYCARAASVLAAFVVLSEAHLAPAANIWDGGGANDLWGTAANWDDNTVPLFPQAITFAGSTRLTPNNDVATSVSGITFDAAAGAFVVGGNALTLSGNVTNNATAAQAISIPLTLDADRTVAVTNAAGSLTLSGVIAGSGFGLTKTGPGSLTLTGANTHTGPTIIQGGKIVVGAGGTLGDGTSALTLGVNLAAGTGNLEITGNSATVASLAVISDNPTTANSISIASGRTLTANGNVTVGGLVGTATSFNAATILNVSGAGSFVAGNGSGGTFIVGNVKGNNTGGGDIIAATALDMSGLATFTANYGPGGIVGVAAGNAGTGANAPFGTLTLAANNTITAGQLNVGLNNGGGNTAKGRLFLGQTNVLNVDSITVGAGKTQPPDFSPTTPNETGLVKFRTGLTNPTVTLRGAAGADSRVTNLTINNGDLYTGGSATDESGTIDFTGGTVDAKIDTLIVGVGANNGNAGVDSFANLTFNAGTIDVSTATVDQAAVRVALEDRVGAITNGDVTGTINVNGTGSLIVGAGGIELAKRTAGTALSIGNLNINGTATIGGDVFTTGLVTGAQGNVTVNGTLNVAATKKLGLATGPLNNVVLNTGSTVNVEEIVGRNITVNSGVNFALPTTFTIPDTGAMTVGAALPANSTVHVLMGGSLTGTGDGVATGKAAAVIVDASGSIRPGTTAADGSVGLLTTTSLTTAGDLRMDTVSVAGNNYDRIAVTGTADFQAGATITLPKFPGAGTYTLLTAANLTGSAPTLNSLGTPSGRPGTVLNLSFDTTLDQIQLTAAGGAITVTWTGTNGSNWDTTTQNWSNNGGLVANDLYFDQDNVVFGDGPTNRNVMLNGSVTPGSVTVNNALANPYTISGFGSIDGATTVTKSGDGTLTLATNNNYTGVTTINAGALQIGDGTIGGTGSLGTGAVVNNAVLALNRGDDIIVSNAISGTGELRKQGPNTVTLSGNNTFTGPVNIQQGTVRVTNSNSLGQLPGGAVTISDGATLDLANSNPNYGQKQFFIQGTGVNGAGALANTGAAAQNAFQEVTLTGNATVNSQARFDIRAGQSGGQNVATLDLAGHTLTKIGTGQFSLVGVDVTAGDIVVNAGLFATETTTSIPAALKPDTSPYTITVNEGATWQVFGTGGNTNQLNVSRQVVINSTPETFTTIRNNSDDNVRIDSPIRLNGNLSIIGLNDVDDGEIEFTGTITETGGARSLTKNTDASGANFTAILSGQASYTGPTTVNAGTLRIGANDRISDVSKLVMVGGTFSTGGFNETLGTMLLQGSGTLDMGRGASTLHFAASSTESWGGSLLIRNWTPGADHIFFGNSATGLDSTQLSLINFIAPGTLTRITSTGEILPSPAATAIKGDFNQDGTFNQFDIQPMLVALTNVDAWKAAYGFTEPNFVTITNIDGNPALTNRDIQALLSELAILGFGSVAAVPEPSSLVLLGLGMTGALFLKRKRAARADWR